MIKVFQETGDQWAHQVPKVLAGNEGRKALESQESVGHQASQESQELKVTQELQEPLDLRGLPVLESQACLG